MKKAILITSSVVLLAAVIIGGFGLYIVSTPEYALKGIIEDVNNYGIDGLTPHLTGKAKETLEAVSSVTESDLFSTIINFFNQDDNNISVLKSEIQQIQWDVDDVLKSNNRADVILSFNYEDKLTGTIAISMIVEEGKWKINSINFPAFTDISW